MSNNPNRKRLRKIERELRKKAHKNAKLKVISDIGNRTSHRGECVVYGEQYPQADEMMSVEALLSSDLTDSLLELPDGTIVSSHNFISNCVGLKAWADLNGITPQTEWEFHLSLKSDWEDNVIRTSLNTDEDIAHFSDWFFAFRYAIEQEFNPNLETSIDDAALLWLNGIWVESQKRKVLEHAFESFPTQPVFKGKTYSTLMGAF